MALAGFNLKQAFGREKPHSSITDWVDIMTAQQTEEESFEGVFELVDAINLQASGPSEAARALRKKMKHGNAHQQYRAIVIMRSLIDNVPQKMKLAFSDSQFLDVLSGILIDDYIDKRVKRRLTVILLAWQDQYKDDPDMAAFQRLYLQIKGKRHRLSNDVMMTYVNEQREKDARKEKEKREAREAKEARKREEAEEKERMKRELEKERSKKNQTGQRKRPFDFEKDKPKVMNSIVEASQASSNLINAIVRVNLETDSLETNAEVQDWLTKAKTAKKVLVRYTQLVENEEIIGTLIETHERLEAALKAYIDLTTNDDDATELATKVANVALKDNEARNSHGPATANSGQFDVTNQVPGQSGESGSKSPYTNLHPDLADLDFKSDTHHLPPPIRPTAFRDEGESDEGDRGDKRGSLSDYSDYDSSGEEDTRGAPAKKSFVTVSDDSGAQHPMVVGPSNQRPVATRASAIGDDDPFADPFADKH